MLKPFIDINLEFRNLRLLFEDRCATSLVRIYILLVNIKLTAYIEIAQSMNPDF